ncbi:MAG: hypothetical protein PHQ64_01175 [Bacilli bacterium]|nr:hypothetical protein [Bacilli bacterium]
MSEYNNKEIKKLLDSIFELDRSMLQLYKNLAKLEIENNKNTKEYKETIEFILMIREITEKKYKLLQEFKPEEFNKGSKKFLSSKDIYITNPTTLEQLIETDDNTIIYDKMIHKVSDIISEYYIDSLKEADEDNDLVFQEERKMLRINNLISKTLALNIINNLNSVIAKTEDKNTKEELIRIKYNYAFYYEDIFLLLIKRNFQVSEEDLKYSPNFIRYNYSTPEFYRKEKNRICMAFIDFESKSNDVAKYPRSKRKNIELIKKILIKSGIDFIDNPLYLERIKYEFLNDFELFKDDKITKEKQIQQTKITY